MHNIDMAEEDPLENMKKLTRAIFNIAHDSLEKDRSLGSTATVVLPNGECGIFPISFSDQHEKRAIYGALAQLAAKYGAVAIILANDARYRTYGKSDTVPSIEPGEIAEDETASEMLWVTLVSPLVPHGFYIAAQYSRSPEKDIVWGSVSEVVGTEDYPISVNIISPWWTPGGGAGMVN